jgi:hypothetical protein
LPDIKNVIIRQIGNGGGEISAVVLDKDHICAG